MRDLIRRSIGPAIEVQISHAPDLPPARVDPNQLELAILNLAINARDAMPRGGTLTIDADAASAERRADVARRRLCPDHRSRHRRRHGRSRRWPARSSRSSRPRTSARAPASACRWSTASPRSSAACSTSTAAPGEGPPPRSGCRSRPRRRSAEELESAAAGPARRGAATILLVDDEELVRIGTAEMLSDLGYEVIEATSGAEALRLLRGGRRA